MPGEEGTLFLMETNRNNFQAAIKKYKLEDQELEDFAENILYSRISHDKKQMLIRQGNNWSIVTTSAKPAAGDGQLSLSDLRMWLDPLEESYQMFDEAVRYQRDFFYVENVHGLDLNWVKRSISSLGSSC